VFTWLGWPRYNNTWQTRLCCMPLFKYCTLLNNCFQQESVRIVDM